MDTVKVKKRYRRVLLKKPVLATAFLALALPAVNIGAQAAAADQSPLLQTLTRKGVLTQEEADQIQQEAADQEQPKQEELIKDSQDKSLADHFVKAFKGLSVGALAYIHYEVGKKGAPNDIQTSFNDFTLTRGYLDVKKAITPWLGARLTTDLTRVGSTTVGNADNTGSTNGEAGSGDWEVRIKYLYAYYKPSDFLFLTNMTGEFGQGHIPWLDFEEHINPYRCVDNMFIEKAGVLNSADIGVNLQGNLDGKLADAKARTGNSHYIGRYGTWHVGVYNGGGYHASEQNGNKPVEGRITVRPLPNSLPGLQLSYFGITGKGNVASDAPDYDVNLGMISYQNPSVILTAQYMTTKGNSSGSWVENGNALKTAGYSFFGAYHLPMLERKLSLFGRYDHFDNDKDNKVAAGDDATYDLYMAGLSYDIYKGNMVVLNYEGTTYGNDSGGLGKAPVIGNNLGNDGKVMLVYQFAF
jgi:hypothetical protein